MTFMQWNLLRRFMYVVLAYLSYRIQDTVQNSDLTATITELKSELI